MRGLSVEKLCVWVWSGVCCVYVVVVVCVCVCAPTIARPVVAGQQVFHATGKVNWYHECVPLYWMYYVWFGFMCPVRFVFLSEHSWFDTWEVSSVRSVLEEVVCVCVCVELFM